MASVYVTRIASNIGALNALNSLTNINKQLATHQGRLQTGKRINSAADDPAGLTIATKMLARSEGLKTALSNIGDASNMLAVAEGGMSKMNDILIQMRNKAEQAASDTLGSTERAAIQTQLSAYSQQIQDLVDQTKWNGVKLLDQTTGAKNFQTGVDEGEYTTWSLPSKMDPTTMGLSKVVSAATATETLHAGSFVNASGGSVPVAQGSTLNNASELTTGGYSIKVLDKATLATQGKATLSTNSTLINNVASLNTVATPAAELASGHYQFKVIGQDTTGHTVDYTITNLDDSTWNTTGSMTVTAKALTNGNLVTQGDATLGINFGWTNGTTPSDSMNIGQSMNFEYIGQGKAKIEVDDAQGQAMSIAQNAAGTVTGTFAYATANNATDYNTGRGISIRLNAFASTVAGAVEGFDYARASNFSVDVSSSAKAGKYMTTVGYAMDKVNSAMSDLGSLMARLTFKEDQVSTMQVNVESSYSRIMNANMAEEQVNASKFAILQQTATAMLAQANQAPQSLLSLFR
jgi:flagellin